MVEEVKDGGGGEGWRGGGGEGVKDGGGGEGWWRGGYRSEVIAGITYHWFILVFLAALDPPNGGTGHHRHGGTKRILTNLAIEHRDV